MTTIGIIGAGVAGLHLGLLLQQHGVAATIYTDKTPEEQRASRIRNIVVRAAPTRERERQLGVNHWDMPAADIARIEVAIGSARPLAFSGAFNRPVSIVDMRMYWARLLEDFAARGGHVVFGACEAGDVERLSAQHDLMVVAAGRGSLANLFPRMPEHCPYQRPQRLIFGGLYHGVARPEPTCFNVVVVPGHGEILLLPAISFMPDVTGVAVEIIEGGAFEVLRGLRYEDDPQRFDATVLGLLRDYAPSIFARVDPQAFRLARPQDHTFTAITPTTRRGYARMANGACVMAVGDAHVLMDPMTGQGANKAVHAAWTLGEAICGGGPFDEDFCRAVEQRMWAFAGPVSEACNARLGPPAPHVLALMAAAARNPAIADAYAWGFNHPDLWWEMTNSPERTAALLQKYDQQAMPAVRVAA